MREGHVKVCRSHYLQIKKDNHEGRTREGVQISSPPDLKGNREGRTREGCTDLNYLQI